MSVLKFFASEIRLLPYRQNLLNEIWDGSYCEYILRTLGWHMVRETQNCYQSKDFCTVYNYCIFGKGSYFNKEGLLESKKILELTVQFTEII